MATPAAAAAAAAAVDVKVEVKVQPEEVVMVVEAVEATAAAGVAAVEGRRCWVVVTTDCGGHGETPEAAAAAVEVAAVVGG